MSLAEAHSPQASDLETRDEPPLGRWVTVAVVALALGIGAYQCLSQAGSVLLFGDEYHSLRHVAKPYGRLVGLFDEHGSGVALLFLQRLGSDLLGAGHWAYRLPAIAGALGTLLLVYPVGQRLVGRTAALVALLALATSGMHVFYSHYGRAYALASALGLCLVWALQHALLDRVVARRWWTLLVAAAALMPYVHLTALAFVLGVGAAGVLAAVLREETRQRWKPLVGALALGLALCALLYLPARESLLEFVREKSRKGVGGPFEAYDVLAMVAGGRMAALVWAALLPAGLVLHVARRGPAGLLLAAAATVPVVALAVSHPVGMVYAYARYVFTALPFQLLVMAWLVVLLVRAAPLSLPAVGGRGRELLALGVGVGLCAAAWISGPLGVRHVDAGPFSNSNLELHDLPPFDLPFPDASGFYAELGAMEGPLTVIEAPELWNRAALLYRNHYLLHGKDVELGFVLERKPERIPAGPYLDLDPETARASGADFLVYHHDLYQELEAYWSFVLRTFPAIERPGDAALVIYAHGDYGIFRQRTEPVREMRLSLREGLGVPDFTDRWVDVWDLRK